VPAAFFASLLPVLWLRAIIRDAQITAFMAVSIEVRHAGKTAVLVLSGRLTIGDSINVLHDAVEERMAAGDKDIVLDMRDVNYVDSTGLGGLVTSLTCARSKGGTLRLANVPRRIQDLLDVSSLYMIFQIIELASTQTAD
jgi:anti-sigma B factor antagonist